MNERIRELHRQVMLWADTPDCSDTVEWDKIPEEYTKKLTELIVRECAERLMQDDFGSVKGVMSIAGSRLKEHFGVRE